MIVSLSLFLCSLCNSKTLKEETLFLPDCPHLARCPSRDMFFTSVIKRNFAAASNELNGLLATIL